MLEYRRAVASITAACLMIAGCHSPPNLERVVVFTRQETPPTVVIVPPEVDLVEYTFSGSIAPRDDWDHDAERTAVTTAQSILARKGIRADLWQPDDAEARAAEQALARRQRDVARQLSAEPVFTGVNGFVIGARRWSVGSVEGLRQDTDARYALFVSLRDQYTSTERVVGQVAMGVLFVAAVVMLGAPLVPPPSFSGPSGQGPAGLQSASLAPTYGKRASRCPEQSGYASLVDLQTGDVVWFNHLWGGCSDLRDPEDLHAALALLLTGFP